MSATFSSRAALAAILALGLAAAPALAAPAGLIGEGIIPVPASASYQGPGDIVSGAVAFWGLRAYDAAIAAAGTQALAHIERVSDSHTCDVLVASNGGLGKTANCSTGGDDGEAVATWCASTTCDITELYDQTGHGANVLYSGTIPELVLSCVNSLPCLSTNGTSAMTASATSYAQGASYSLEQVAYYTATGSEDANGVQYGQAWLGPTSTSGQLALWSDNSVIGATGSLASSTWSIETASASGASSTLNLNGTKTTGTYTYSSANSYAGIYYDYAGGITFETTEAGAWTSAAFTSAQRSALCHNAYEYWKAGASC